MPPMAPDGDPGRFRRATRAVGRGVARFANGIPLGFVAALASLVLIAILFTVAARKPDEARGYTELTVTPGGCVIDMTRQDNAVACQVLGPRSYRVIFSGTLKGSTPIASRGSCCPGSIGASTDGDRTVILALRRKVTSPIRVSVLVP
jgi:hypothetical protein